MRVICLFILYVCLATPVVAEELYLDAIKPVLKERCYACHGALKQKSGLRLDTAQHIVGGAETGTKPVLVPGDVSTGELLRRVTSDDLEERMPPEGEPLEAEEIEAIRSWIASGAPVPENEEGDDDPRDHWAFRRIEKPSVPGDDHRNPVDAFLAASQHKHMLEPQPEAERPLLLRRLYLDLIGLPPTVAQLRDERPYEIIVDELLASPQHGERWARHWMDVWRYSDWYGLDDQLRNSQKHMWHWRDWIVDSLNADKGYDRMISEMLAGDEIAPDDPKVVVATGFLARNYYLFNRTTWLDDTIEHTGKAFLGLTLNCAKCHDHKYDPITQLDYYRFRAIFEPHQVRLDPVPGVIDLEKDGLPRAFDDHLDAVTHLHRKGDEKNPDQETKIEPGVPSILAAFASSAVPIELPLGASIPGTREHVGRDHLAAAHAEWEKARAALASLPDVGARPASADFAASDTFDGSNESLWEISGDDWEYGEGALRKTMASRENNFVRLRPKPPRDFELVAHYTTTGGTTYKSIGFRFDCSEDGRAHHQIYTSAHESEPKMQVSHTVDGQDLYPPIGSVARPIKVGERYELKFAVRDRLLNVWLNGDFVLAYQLPVRHPDGSIAFFAFDATAAFDSISIRALAPEVELKPSGGVGSLEVAQAEVAWREAELVALRKIIAADQALSTGEGNTAVLGEAASRAEREARLAKAHFEILRDRDDAGKLEAAKARMAEAEKATPGSTYTPIRASRKALETPEHKFEDYKAFYPASSTGRRLALAKWIVHRDNPLTARVAVNQVWMRHFGEPLVEKVFDFGRQSKCPEHAELLDFLSVEFIESGWSFKHLHRLLVTSAAYRRSSANAGAEPATLAADPSNRIYWRMNPRRMESQVARDSLLSLGGVLDLAVGGVSLDPAAQTTRRSLYLLHSREQQDKFLSMFDDADILACYRRSESIVPQQALALSNSKLALDTAEKIAAGFAASDRTAFIEAAFFALLARTPDDPERDACLAFCEDLDRLGTSPESRVRSRLVHALLNHNDFITVR